MKKVMFLDTVHPCLQQELEALGYICEYKTRETRQEVEKIIHDYTGIIVRSRITLDKEILSKAEKLRFIGRSGSGLESIDVDFAASRGIQCFNSPEGNRDAVAEQALGMLLCLMNNICKADREVRRGEWHREANRGIELNGKTIGLIGYGNTGSTFAKKLSGFDVRVLAYDKYNKPGSTHALLPHVSESNMQQLFDESDFLSLHVPLTEETQYLVNNDFISRFKKNIYLLNTSRGPVVKTDDLAENLEKGKILGACLDVIEYEETSFEILGSGVKETADRGAFEFLKKSEKVILTPHIAGWTIESYIKLSKVLSEKIKEAFH